MLQEIFLIACATPKKHHIIINIVYSTIYLQGISSAIGENRCMWYTTIKTSQVWSVSYDTYLLGSAIEALYEITYKYQTMIKHDFAGHPTRYQNILQNLEKTGRQIIFDITNTLREVFARWLEYHALLNPHTWAYKRLEEHEESVGDDASAYYSFIMNTVGGVKIQENEIVDAISHYIRQNKMPHLAEYLNLFKNDIIESLVEDDSERREEITEETNNMDFDDIYYTYFNDLETLLQEADSRYEARGVVLDIASTVLFDIWYGKWKPQGIDKTRERVQKAYDMIGQLKSMPFSQALATINIIINTAHQTGGMVDYITQQTGDHEQELLTLLEDLSNRSDFSKWDAQLREVGVKI